MISMNIGDRHAVLRQMHAKGTIKDEQYFKGVIGLAHEYATSGQVEDARQLIRECDKGYLSIILPSQMEDDPDFAAVAFEVAGLVSELIGEKKGIEVVEEPEAELPYYLGPVGRA